MQRHVEGEVHAAPPLVLPFCLLSAPGARNLILKYTFESPQESIQGSRPGVFILGCTLESHEGFQNFLVKYNIQPE